MTDGDEMGAGPQAAAGERQYETKVVQAIRGTESRSEAKWRKEGWELVSQSPGTLRTEMTFRRVKPKTFGALLAQGYTAFRGLQPKTQQVLAAVVGGLVLVLVAAGIFLATLGGDDTPRTGATPTEAATPSEASVAPTPQPAAESSTEEAMTEDEPTQEATTEDEPTEEATEEPEVDEVEPYSYAGPQYEIVTVDEDVILEELDVYWVLIGKLDYSDPGYKDRVKMVVTDVAREAGTQALEVQVVSDEEIVEAESADTIEAFMEEHAGDDYFERVMVPKEKSDWVASFRGGVVTTDDGIGLSEAPDAYEIVWLPYDTSETETWKPEISSS